MTDRPYIRRSLEPVIRRAVEQFPAVTLTGPRQAGKTTLLQHLFGDSYRYVSLDLPDVREAATADPRGFLDAYPPPVVFDEVQHAPDLLPYVRERIDADRTRPGQYILTGSQSLHLMERVTESLAGRTAVLRLLPLSRREEVGEPGAPLPWEPGATVEPGARPPAVDAWRMFLRGQYPELVAHPDRDPLLWHASYVQTYLERDVRMVRQVGDLGQFQGFLRALAARSAALLNLSELARDLGIAVNTVKAWLAVLEATDQILILRPYFVSLGKRLVKRPKVYFTDVGTLCYLVGLRDPEHARAGPMAGAIVETAVVSEVYRRLLHRGAEARLHFWRTSSGSEVDLVVEAEGGVVPLEVKASATPRPPMAAGIQAFREALGARAAPGFLVHLGSVRHPLGGGVTALPVSDL